MQTAIFCSFYNKKALFKGQLLHINEERSNRKVFSCVRMLLEKHCQWRLIEVTLNLNPKVKFGYPILTKSNLEWTARVSRERVIYLIGNSPNLRLVSENNLKYAKYPTWRWLVNFIRVKVFAVNKNVYLELQISLLNILSETKLYEKQISFVILIKTSEIKYFVFWHHILKQLQSKN